MTELNCYLITGLSGAGKSHALQAFEDLGVHCVDNLPGELVESFVELSLKRASEKSDIALILDVRERRFVQEFPGIVDQIKQPGVNLEIIFLEASRQELLRRYRESRRPHPLAVDQDLETAIELEEKLLAPVRQQADQVLDTTRINIHQLKTVLADRCSTMPQKKFVLSLVSFGFKNNVPGYLDLLFDCRMLPNPHYHPELREKTGIENDIEDFMEQQPETSEYFNKLVSFLKTVVRLYQKTDKHALSVGLGCTGGRHRSVCLVEKIAEVFRDVEELELSITHRDIHGSG